MPALPPERDLIPLSQQNLDRIRELGVVPVPDYDRDGLIPGIVHLGVGGFHRAHQAMAVDALLASGKARDFAICGVGVLEQDRRMKTIMNEQDGLYTLVLKHPDGRRESRVIGSICEYLLAVDQRDEVLERMAAPTTRIVSLTITEGGYNLDPVTGLFDASDQAVLADAARITAPTTVFGLVVAALRLRRERALPPFTIQSCDNIQGNGQVARAVFIAFAELVDPDLAEWISHEVAFPDSMVDRITPVTSDADRAEVQDSLGVLDAWPVVAEPFFQWVIEDHFPQGRPPFEDAGAQLVADVEPYELMKLRLLNASHQALTYFGYLAGYRYAHEATGDPLIADLLLRYMTDEATPTLSPVPGINLNTYRRTLIERFSNPEVKDTLERLCAESSDRIPKWLLPVVRANLSSGGDVRLSAAVVASWARYAEGLDEAGEPITIVDRLSDTLIPLAQSQREHPAAFIENTALFGDLAQDDRFRESYLAVLASLIADGSLATLRRLDSGTL